MRLANRSDAARGTADSWRSPGAVLALGCRLAVGVVFLYASLDKIVHADGFAQAVYNYRILPLALLHPFALYLPALEATVGVVLLAGFWRRGAALLATLMTAMFIVAIAAALARSLDISCGCFSTEGGHGIGTSLLIRDVLLLAAAVVPLLTPHPGWGIADLIRRR